MKYYEVHYPYYALIKAENKETARDEYVANVAADDGTLLDEMEEVERDYALVMYSRVRDDNGKWLPISEILEDFQSGENLVLLIDPALV